MSFTLTNAATIRKRHGIPPCHSRDARDPDGEMMSVHQAAAELGITASTLYRWLNDEFVPGEQVTSGAPWQIRLTPAIRDLVAGDAPAGWVPVQVATAALGVSRQTVLRRVNRGELRAVHIRTGRRKGRVSSYPPPKTAFLTIPRQSRSSVMPIDWVRDVTYREDKSRSEPGTRHG